MAYEKITWINDETPLNAANLNRMEDGIAEALQKLALDYVHPIGSFYETSDPNFDPRVTWGGTWELLGEGQVLLSAGENYTVGTVYGKNTRKLTDQEIAHGHSFTQPVISSHNHKMTNETYIITTNATSGLGRTSVKAGTGTAVANLVQSTGGALSRGTNMTQTAQPTASGGKVADLYGASGTRAEHSVMQKSTAVNIWHRTA